MYVAGFCTGSISLPLPCRCVVARTDFVEEWNGWRARCGNLHSGFDFCCSCGQHKSLPTTAAAQPVSRTHALVKPYDCSDLRERTGTRCILTWGSGLSGPFAGYRHSLSLFSRRGFHNGSTQNPGPVPLNLRLHRVQIPTSLKAGTNFKQPPKRSTCHTSAQHPHRPRTLQ